MDGYYKRARDLLDDGQFGAAYILTAFNYDKAEVWGVEWKAKFTTEQFHRLRQFLLGSRNRRTPSCPTRACSRPMSSTTSPISGSTPTTRSF